MLEISPGSDNWLVAAYGVSGRSKSAPVGCLELRRGPELQGDTDKSGNTLGKRNIFLMSSQGVDNISSSDDELCGVVDPLILRQAA